VVGGLRLGDLAPHLGEIRPVKLLAELSQLAAKVGIPGLEHGLAAQLDQVVQQLLALLGEAPLLQGLGSLYGVDTGLLGRGLAIPAELLKVRANASRDSGFNFGLGPFSFGVR